MVSFISQKRSSERFSSPVERGSIFLQMVEVPHVLAFTVTIGSQLMAFAEEIVKFVQYTKRLIHFGDSS